MSKQTDQHKPEIDDKAKLPETHAQTKPLEDKLSPQHNTTEPYGKSSDHARQSTDT